MTSDDTRTDGVYEVIGNDKSPEEVLAYWVDKWDAIYSELVELRGRHERDMVVFNDNIAIAERQHDELVQLRAALAGVTTERDRYKIVGDAIERGREYHRARADTAEAALAAVRELVEAAKVDLPHAPYTGVSWARLAAVLGTLTPQGDVVEAEIVDE